jgi:hypothetical protein
MNIASIVNDIDEMSASEAARVAFVAICRIGNHGRDAGEAFAALAKSNSDPDFEEGCAQIADLLA